MREFLHNTSTKIFYRQLDDVAIPFAPALVTFEIEVNSTQPFKVVNAYLNHDDFYGLGMAHDLINFEADDIPLTLPGMAVVFPNDPYDWVRGAINEFWEKDIMANRKLYFEFRTWNTIGPQVKNFYLWLEVKLTESQKIEVTFVVQ